MLAMPTRQGHKPTQSVTEYAAQLLDLYFDDADGALVELFNGPKVYPQVPNQFWADVHAEIRRLAANTRYEAVGYYTDGRRVVAVFNDRAAAKAFCRENNDAVMADELEVEAKRSYTLG